MDNMGSATAMGGTGVVRLATDADKELLLSAGLLPTDANSVSPAESPEPRSGTCMTLVAEAMGRHLGALSLRFQPDCRSATVEGVSAVPGAWTNSIFRSLLSKAEEMVWERGMAELNLEGPASPGSAVAVLRRLGFEQAHHGPDATQENVLHLRKKLTRRRTRIRHLE